MFIYSLFFFLKRGLYSTVIKHYSQLVVHICNPNTGEAEAGGWEFEPAWAIQTFFKMTNQQNKKHGTVFSPLKNASTYFFSWQLTLYISYLCDVVTRNLTRGKELFILVQF